MSIDIGKKIIILGCCGSGKSVFAKKLNEKTGLPLYHLDNIYWNDDSLNPELVKWVKDFHTQDRPRLCSLIEKYSDKQVFIFNTRDQADKWLANL